MKISGSSWENYINKLRKVNDKATERMTEYLQTHEVVTQDDRKQMLDYAYGLATYYGEGAAELACQMYDAAAAAQGAKAPPAEPADTATYGETAKAVQGAMKQSDNPSVAGSAVGRLVKQAGVDTTMKNAIRDGAEWAWIPSGDTCAFCLTLASRGFQKASKKVLKGNHAEHIHADCDCTFFIRFDGKSTLEGYDPEALLDQYYTAEGDTPQEKINSLRREQYQLDKDRINERKRGLYARERRLKYGEQRQFQSDRYVIRTRKVDKYGYNNLFVDDQLEISERELRTINDQISAAKEVLGITDTCNVPVVVSNLDEGVLASYNPKTNIIRISPKMSSRERILQMQCNYACPNDRRSTAVHELLHWSDADAYRKLNGIIDDAGPDSQYTLYERNQSRIKLQEAGIDLNNLQELQTISQYAMLSALANDWEEVYTEFRTKELLDGK